MSKVIESIQEVKGLPESAIHSSLAESVWNRFDGYQVTCSDGSKYSVVIDNGQGCCEHWGYLTSEDNLREFIGAQLLDVTVTDKVLNTKVLEPDSLQAEECVFVTFQTDKGDFQLVAYNQHNGYYGHDVLIALNDRVIQDYR